MSLILFFASVVAPVFTAAYQFQPTAATISVQCSAIGYSGP